MSTLDVAGYLVFAPLAPSSQRLPQGRHHGDGRCKDAVNAVGPQEFENDLRAPLGIRHDILPLALGTPDPTTRSRAGLALATYARLRARRNPWPSRDADADHCQ